MAPIRGDLQSLDHPMGDSAVSAAHSTKVETQLKLNQERANRIFEAAPNAMFVIRGSGAIESANAAAMRLFGYSWEQLVGMNVDQLLPEHLRKAHTHHRQSYIEDPKARAMGQGKALSAIKADGSAFPVEIGLTPLMDEDGLSVIVSVIDLSTQVKAHDEIKRLNHELATRLSAQSETLNQTEKDLRSVLDNMPSMIGYWDKQLRNRFGNRAFLDWFGISPQNMPGMHIKDVIGEEGFELNRSFIEGALAGKTQFFERSIPSPDGASIRHTQAQYLPDINDQGEVMGFYVLVNDVTPIKKAQAKAQDLLHFNQAIIKHSPVGIAVYHPDGKCLIANHALAKAYGETEEDLQNQNFYDIPHWHASGMLEDALNVLSDGKPRERVCITQSAEGLTIYLSCNLQPIVLNERVHLLLIANDITRLETAKKTISDALNTAKKAAEAKGEFLASMSHEIRTPLNAVLGLAQIGQRQSRDSQTSKAFAQINESGQHLLALINDVLDFSKIEAGKLSLKQSSVHTATLLQHLCTIIDNRAQAKGLRFVIDESPDFPAEFHGDDVRVAQILINLLGNAVKFTTEGHIQLRLLTDANSLIFEVDDSGQGIPAEQLEKLFLPFEQLTKQAAPANGSGLGLAISKQLCALMGGQLKHMTKEASGCCFQFSLPKRNLRFFDWPTLPTISVCASDAKAMSLAKQMQARACNIDVVLAEQDLYTPERIVLTSQRPTANETAAAPAKLILLLTNDHGSASEHAVDESKLVLVPEQATPLMLKFILRGKLEATETKLNRNRLEGIKILAAEDNPVNRLVLEQMILQEGASIEFGFDGQQALNLVEQNGPDHYDVMLCDIQMPIMDGFETTRALATMAPQLPVIGLTAHAFETARLQARDAGMVDYVTKPYLLDTLVNVILKHARPHANEAKDEPTTLSNPTMDPAYPDWKAMQDHFGNNPALMSKLTETLKVAGAEILQNMSDAIARQDFGKLRQEAHSLKGAALNLHTPQLAKQAAELQNLASLQAPLAWSLATDLIGHFEHFLAFLDEPR